MNRPTYYLWKDDAASQETLEQAKKCLEQMGFRTVIFKNGKKDGLMDAILSACRLEKDVIL